MKESRNWKRRGFYSESILVKLLQSYGYEAIRVPVNTHSLNPLPDVIARNDLYLYAFKVRNASYYAYFPKRQIEKLFAFLDKFIPSPNQNKYVVLAAHFGKKWRFKVVEWADRNKLPKQIRILKRDKGNFDLKTGERK